MPVWRVVASGPSYGNEVWANVFHINPGGTFNHAEVLDAFESFYSQPAPTGGMSILAPLPGVVGTTIGVALTQLSLQELVTPAPPDIRVVSHNGGVGGAGGLPVAVSEVSSWRTSLAGRRHRGRTYIPAVHSSHLVSGPGNYPSLDPLVHAGWAVQCTHLLQSLLTANAVHPTYSRVESAPHAVTGGYIDSGFDTQRRRGNKAATTRTTFTGP